MKKLLCAILTVALCISLAGCGRASAESVVEDALQAFQSADSEAIQKYWNDAEFTVETSELDTADEEYNQKLLELFAENMTYEITGSAEDENAGTAEVTAEITSIDMSVVLPEWIGEVISQTLGYALLPASQLPSDEELGKMYMDSLIDLAKEHVDEKTTRTVDISLTLVDNEWKINADDAVVDAMLGGLMNGLSAFNEIGDTAEDPAEKINIPETAVEPLRTNPAVLGDYTVEIQSATLTHDYSGEPAVVIEYSWTNNSDETTSPVLSVTTSVFQDGIGLTPAFVFDDSIYDGSMSMTDVRPGATINVQEVFSLNNNTSTIEVEITQVFSWAEPTEIAYKQYTFE